MGLLLSQVALKVGSPAFFFDAARRGAHEKISLIAKE